MVARQNQLEKAAHAVEHALWELVQNRTSDQVHVFDTEWGHLWALVGSDTFKGMNVVERQDLVWEHLRQRVNQEDLAHLTRVDPMDHDEYKARCFEVTGDRAPSGRPSEESDD